MANDILALYFSCRENAMITLQSPNLKDLKKGLKIAARIASLMVMWEG